MSCPLSERSTKPGNITYSLYKNPLFSTKIQPNRKRFSMYHIFSTLVGISRGTLRAVCSYCSNNQISRIGRATESTRLVMTNNNVNTYIKGNEADPYMLIQTPRRCVNIHETVQHKAIIASKEVLRISESNSLFREHFGRHIRRAPTKGKGFATGYLVQPSLSQGEIYQNRVACTNMY